MRVHQRNGQEEWLLLRRRGAKVRESAFLAGIGITIVMHVSPIVVDDTTGGLADELVCAGVLWVPSLEPEAVDILWHPAFIGDAGRLLGWGSVAIHRLAAVPLALVGCGIASGRHDRTEVREIERQLNLRILRRGHVGFKAVLDAVLRREEAAHHGCAAG